VSSTRVPCSGVACGIARAHALGLRPAASCVQRFALSEPAYPE